MTELGTTFALLCNIPQTVRLFIFYLFNKYTPDPEIDGEDIALKVIDMVPNSIVYSQ